MKLWEAMLKGAKMGPQLFNEQRDGRGGSCAYGALILGLDGPVEYAIDEPCLIWSFPELAYPCACPAGPCASYTSGQTLYKNAPGILQDVIVHLNNDHMWSRQRIAEWLANRELKFKESQPIKQEATTNG